MTGGERSTRLALAMRVPRAVHRARTVAAIVRIAGNPANLPLRVTVDGVPLRATAGSTVRADVIPGTHEFSAASVDGTLGARAVTATLAAGGEVALQLWPERTVSGRVRLADSQSVDAGTSLAGIVVTVSPGDASALTDADGTFFFGKQPLPPDAVVAVDPDTLPQSLRAPDPQPLRGTAIEIVLPGRAVDERTFPSAQPHAKRPLRKVR
jgi:hypothetical protein